MTAEGYEELPHDNSHNFEFAPDLDREHDGYGAEKHRIPEYDRDLVFPY